MKRELTYLTQFRILTQEWRRLGTCMVDNAVIRMLSDNVQYQLLMIPIGTYAGRELLSMLEGMVELNQFVVDDKVIKKNKLKGITEIILNLNELDNSDNLKDGRPGNELLTYHMTDDKDFTSFKPQTPQYKALKNNTITSLPENNGSGW